MAEPKKFSKPRKQRGFKKGKQGITSIEDALAGARPKLASSPEEDEAREVAYRICGDFQDSLKIAKQFLTLRENPDYDGITLPEAVYMLWLEASQVEYVYQNQLYGGRLKFGGAVPDFLLVEENVMVLVQGEYWHNPANFPGKQARDELLITKMLGTIINGVLVSAVIQLWESDVLGCNREFHFRNSVAGVESSLPPWAT